VSGHVFIVHGDLRRLACDAWLMPCDSQVEPLAQWYQEPEPLPRAFRWPAPPDGWGDSGVRVMPVPGWPATRPRPWLVNVGSGPGTPLQWFVEGARQFLEAVGPTLGTPRNSRFKPLVALPVVGTGGGGGWKDAGQIVCQLLPVLYAAARQHDMDVALVTIEAAAFAAAQAQRHRTVEDAWPELNHALRQEAGKLAGRAARGDLVLFLGAGVGRSAGLPLWMELLTELADEAGLSSQRKALAKLNPLDQAQVIEGRMGGTRRLGDAVAGKLRTPYYGLSHALLAALPVEEAVTTNYDQLFELASEATGRRTAVLPYNAAADSDRWLLKMHGCVSEPGRIVLTRAAYLRYADNRAALAAIVQALLITRHMLFVGFSLDDDNFHQIIDAVRKAVGRTSRSTPGTPFGTCLALFREEVVEELWRHDLHWVEMMQGTDQTSMMQAGRMLEIFLDHVLALTASTGHLMDPRFDAVLADPERQLRELLQRFLADIDHMGPAVKETGAWVHIARMLRSLGGG